jgi:hypothetical protein
MGGMKWLLGEPDRDSELAAALRQAEPACDAAGEDSLRRRIMTRARPKLMELQLPAGHWWDWLSGWVRIAVPVGLAASLAAGLLLPHSVATDGLGTSTGEMGADSMLIAAAFSEPTTRGQVAAHLITPESNDWLLEQVLTQ